MFWQLTTAWQVINASGTPKWVIVLVSTLVVLLAIALFLIISGLIIAFPLFIARLVFHDWHNEHIVEMQSQSEILAKQAKALQDMKEELIHCEDLLKKQNKDHSGSEYEPID